jgi:hypothetical protein
MSGDQDIADAMKRQIEEAEQRLRLADRRVPRAYTAADLGEAGQTMADAAKAEDLVNSPPHYRQGGVECIDGIEAALTPEEFRGYCKGNALKYVWRERHKGAGEDVKKALWYLDRIGGSNGT